MAPSISCFNTIIPTLLVIAIFVFFYLYRSPKSAKNRRKAPEVAGGWPVIGHLPLLKKSSLLHITLGNLVDKYGPIFSIRIGTRPALVVSSWELAKECFTINDVAVSSRPKQIQSKHLAYNNASFGFSPYGPYWREMRKISVSQLLSSHRLELLRHVRAFEVETSIKGLFNIWSNKSTDGKVMIEMKQWFEDLILNMILRMVVGKRYFGGNVTDDMQEARRCQKAVRELFRLSGLFVLGDVIPFLAWLDVGGHEKAMKRCGTELDEIASKWLQEHHQKRQTCQIKEELDFMDVLVSSLDSSNVTDYDADTINKATCMNLVSGALDTTVVTLTWALALLLNNAHALKKAQNELNLHVGKKRLVNESDISNLVYLQAIVKEALRLYPVAPLGGRREFQEDCIIGGYYVPKGTRLLVNLKKLQVDPRVWSDPLEFKPERFLSTHKDVDVMGQHFELLPFGAGRRICPGIRSGLQMIHLVLGSFLQAFDVSTPNDHPVDMTEAFGVTNTKATPLEVVIAPRLSLNLVE